MLFRSTTKILFTVLLLSLISAAQSFSRADYTVGGQPNSVVSADFNGDGVADLAVTNSVGNSVSILLGRGDGSFGAATSVTVGANPTELVTADFNGDGHPDLAIANAKSPAVTILLGNVDGSFRRVDAAAGGGQVSITSGDFNSDGHVDLAVAVAGNVQVLIGNGDGTFRAGASFTTAVTPMQVRAADLNADGRLDLAVGACCQGRDVTYGAFYAYQGNGDGTFTQKFSSDQPDGTKLTVADVTGDGLPDLILPYAGCHTPCQGVEVVINNGNFAFTRFGGGGADDMNYAPPGPAIVGDFTGSGHLQIAASVGPGENSSANGLDKMLIWSVGSGSKFSTQRDYAIGVNTSPWGAVAADFNHDGKADIAVAEEHTGKIAVFLNDTGSPASQRTFNFSLQYSPQTVTAGGAAKYQYYVEATNGTLPSPMQLSCSGLPTGASCTFDTTPSGNTTLGWLTISTTPKSSAALHHSFGWLALALPFGFVMVPVRGRKWLWFGLLAIAVAVVLQVGCAGGGKNLTNAALSGNSTSAPASNTGANAVGTTPASSTGISGASDPSTSTNANSGGTTAPAPAPAAGPTPAGTYQVTVTAAGGGLTQSQTITLIVQ